MKPVSPEEVRRTLWQVKPASPEEMRRALWQALGYLPDQLPSSDWKAALEAVRDQTRQLADIRKIVK